MSYNKRGVLMRSGSRSCGCIAGRHAVLLPASSPYEHWQTEGCDWNLVAFLQRGCAHWRAVLQVICSIYGIVMNKP